MCDCFDGILHEILGISPEGSVFWICRNCAEEWETES